MPGWGSLGPTDDKGFQPHQSLDLAEIYKIFHATWVWGLKKVHPGTREKHSGHR